VNHQRYCLIEVGGPGGEVEVNGVFSDHDLRHEATSRLFEKGFDTMEVRTITGHKTLQMLARYTHLREEDLVERMK